MLSPAASYVSSRTGRPQLNGPVQGNAGVLPGMPEQSTIAEAPLLPAAAHMATQQPEIHVPPAMGCRPATGTTRKRAESRAGQGKDEID